MTAITADYFRSTALQSNSLAASGTSVRALSKVGSVSASALNVRAEAELARIAAETAFDGWDGYSAKSISESTLSRAYRFLVELPDWIPPPDIVPEADGEIAIEWFLSPNLTFSVSIPCSGPVHFAGRFGDEKLHGAAPHDSSIPESVLQMLGLFFRKAGARRAA
jgi:hypothetical protein